jgi:hypothetical protein
MKLEFAKNDIEWSKGVKERANYKCAWADCAGTDLDAHHIIGRGLLALRLLFLNGVCLCKKHHNIVEEVKGRKKYAALMVLLVGKVRYQILLNLERKFKKELVRIDKQSDGLESSKVDF